jgi:hypothetical protein
MVVKWVWILDSNLGPLPFGNELRDGCDSLLHNLSGNCVHFFPQFRLALLN